MWDFCGDNGPQAKLVKDFDDDMLQAYGVATGSHNPVPLRLTSLRLIGVDFAEFDSLTIGTYLELKTLYSLSLESCSGLETVFKRRERAQSQANAHCPRRLDNLRVLTVRSELSSLSLQSGLQNFLSSLSGLSSLVVTLEGTNQYTMNMRTVLEIHGNTLRSLVWDLRGTGETLRQIDAVHMGACERVNVISSLCPNLVELSMPLDWLTFNLLQPKVHHLQDFTSRLSLSLYADSWKISKALSQLRLNTLNIRNIPATDHAESWPFTEFMLKGLAVALLSLLPAFV